MKKGSRTFPWSPSTSHALSSPSFFHTPPFLVQPKMPRHSTIPALSKGALHTAHCIMFGLAALHLRSCYIESSYRRNQDFCDFDSPLLNPVPEELNRAPIFIFRKYTAFCLKERHDELQLGKKGEIKKCTHLSSGSGQ